MIILKNDIAEINGNIKFFFLLTEFDFKPKKKNDLWYLRCIMYGKIKKTSYDKKKKQDFIFKVNGDDFRWANQCLAQEAQGSVLYDGLRLGPWRQGLAWVLSPYARPKWVFDKGPMWKSGGLISKWTFQPIYYFSTIF